MKKILVIRFSSIGDIVLTTPVIRCLKQQLENTEVHFLTKEKFRPVLEANPYIDRIITINEVMGVMGITINEVMGVMGVMKVMKGEGYDYIVDLHKNLRSWQVIIGLRKPFGNFTKLNIRKFLICKFKINRLPDIHIVDRYFRAVKTLGVRNDGKGLDYFIPAGTDPREKLPDLPREGFIALVIGGKHATKQLPKEKLVALCQKLSGPVILLGGPEDKSLGDAIINELSTSTTPDPHYSNPDPCSLFPDPHSTSPDPHSTSPDPSSPIPFPPPPFTSYTPPINTCGRLSLNESATLIRNASLVITHDTGLMHIAAAFSKNIISVWGNTIPEFGMYPYFPEDYKGHSKILEVKGLRCRPCSKLGYKKCPEGHFKCMMDIDPDVTLKP
ncbi:MAG: glycosyltransferase family 9 protein [Bacteroidetes bacterium]|nr:glycosyltransferase family 9 protein [Bacteroidota bacterium]